MACADPERFIRRGPRALTLLFLVDDAREETKSGPMVVQH